MRWTTNAASNCIQTDLLHRKVARFPPPLPRPASPRCDRDPRLFRASRAPLPPPEQAEAVGWSRAPDITCVINRVGEDEKLHRAHRAAITRIAHPPYRSIILAKALMRYDGGELERGERCAVGAGDGAGGDAVEGVRKL